MLRESKGNMYNWILPNINELMSLYFVQKMSTTQIAKKYRVTAGAVKIKLNRYGIKLRTSAEGQILSPKANHIKLSDEAIDYIDGLLLGDGSIGITKEKKSACYRHTDKRKAYLIYLKKELKRFNIKTSKIYKEPRGYYHVISKYYREFVDIRNKWYINSIKSIPKNMIMSPMKLKNWYIGDGSCDKKSKSEKVTIAIDSKVPNRNILVKELNRIGINISVYKNSFYIKNKKTFFEYMLSNNSYVPKCYRYKFPQE